jgi:hypothetical protein
LYPVAETESSGDRVAVRFAEFLACGENAQRRAASVRPRVAAGGGIAGRGFLRRFQKGTDRRNSANAQSSAACA